VSPDGMYYWDGQRWVSALSPDGRQRWNGAAWEPFAGPAYAMAPFAPARPPRQPTSWTRPLQYAVIARYLAAALYGLTLPFVLSGYMSQVMQQSLQRQQSTYPPGEGPPPGFTDMMTSILTASLWVGTLIGLAIAGIVIVAAIKRWTWAYYAILVLVGFTLLGTVYNLADLVSGGLLSARQGVQPPEWTRISAYAFGAVDTALFVWMLVALIRRGPWGMGQAR
jgi:hypothetical protein